MLVFRNLDCLSLVVCSNTTLLKLQTMLFLLFPKFCASKLGVRLIYGCGLYTDVYGIIFSMALQRQAEDAFSVTSDKCEAVKMQALTTACAGKWSSMLNILALAFVISRPISSIYPNVNF